MKELKTKIKFLSDAHSIAEVKDGYSGATKFYFEKNGRKFFLKIGTFNIRTVEMILNDIHFIFKKKNIHLYEQALSIMRDSLDYIKKHKEFFE